MSISNLTGSERLRFKEIEEKWLTFEPISYPDFSYYKLYTVGLGQSIEPELLIESGSFSNISGTIEIEKIIHRFDDETEASKFLTEIGINNISSYKENREENELGEEVTTVEIQVINFPKLDLFFSLLDAKLNKGFIVEVFKSGSIEEGGVRKVTDKIIKDKRGRIISDTYLKYFDIKSDL